MSLLPATSHANPTTPFWATTGGGGGGGVTGVFAGSGINVDTNTGDVTVSNSGVLTMTAGTGIQVDNSTGNVTVYNTEINETNIASVYTDSNTLGINNGDTWTAGIIKQTNFYPTEYVYYTVGMTINISNIISSVPNYDGNIWVTLDYTDGVTVSLQGRQTIHIKHTDNNYYSASLVIGFQHIPDGQLYLNITNESGAKLNSFDYTVTNFYSVKQGMIGANKLPIY